MHLLDVLISISFLSEPLPTTLKSAHERFLLGVRPNVVKELRRVGDNLLARAILFVKTVEETYGALGLRLIELKHFKIFAFRQNLLLVTRLSQSKVFAFD